MAILLQFWGLAPQKCKLRPLIPVYLGYLINVYVWIRISCLYYRLYFFEGLLERYRQRRIGAPYIQNPCKSYVTWEIYVCLWQTTLPCLYDLMQALWKCDF